MRLSGTTGRVVIGVDVGGTKIATVLVGDDRTILHRLWTTHHATSYESILGDIVSAVRCCDEVAATNGVSVATIGVSVAGWLSRDREHLLEAANLGSKDRPIRADLARLTERAIVVENDGNAAAVAEERLSRRPRTGVLALIALGTGVGGGIIVDGRPLIGASGNAGELGHLRVDSQGKPCVCGGIDCLELYASGPGIALAAGTTSPANAVDAAKSGDIAALRAIGAAGRAIARAITLLHVTVDPGCIVLGGMVALAAADLLLPIVRDELATHHALSVVSRLPTVELALLGAEASALGAAELALDYDSGVRG